ncbi:hypothetical protein H5410_005069 [Solanum commersonii]|uniref:Uncharacterized protein n=1 Tax=Solanum commersonii TaxID=4109 RepID=A0A9J6A6D8_SOLCO|nr:hypothetical protein H5410_005069 [Solanum commersonii]
MDDKDKSLLGDEYSYNILVIIVMDTTWTSSVLYVIYVVVNMFNGMVVLNRRVELTQEIDQFGSDIHDLEAYLNKKIEASQSQLPSSVDDDQLVEQKEEL